MLRAATWFGLALGIATTGLAQDAGFDLSTVKTRTLYGLEGPQNARAISNEVLGNDPLEGEGIASLAGRNLRTRFWTIRELGGIVPIHDHANRPAVFTILTGEIWEYSSTAEERILHSAGGLALEEGQLAHWWLNEGDEVVHLIAFDVFQPRRDDTPIEIAGTPETAAFDLPEAAGVDHALLGVVNVGAHFDGAFGDGYALTTYRTTLEPGGVFPSFGGGGEPLQMFVWQGEVTEHRSDADAPIVMAERTGSSFVGGVTGYWENTSDVPAVLYFGAVEPVAKLEGIPRVGILAHGEHKS